MTSDPRVALEYAILPDERVERLVHDALQEQVAAGVYSESECDAMETGAVNVSWLSSNPDRQFQSWIFRAGTEVVGCFTLLASDESGVAVCEQFVVAREHRQKGNGRKLWRCALAAAMAQPTFTHVDVFAVQVEGHSCAFWSKLLGEPQRTEVLTVMDRRLQARGWRVSLRRAGESVRVLEIERAQAEQLCEFALPPTAVGFPISRDYRPADMAMRGLAMGDDVRSWLIVSGDPGVVIGDVNLRHSAVQSPRLELSYQVASAWQGKGIASTAVNNVFKGLSPGPGCEVVAETLEGNPASERVLQKCGFRPVEQRAHGTRWSLRFRQG